MTLRPYRPAAAHLLSAAMLLAAAAPCQSTLIGSCAIVIGAAGTLKINAALNTLSSRQAGGSAATATANPQSVLCNIAQLLDCYTISITNPAGFASAPGGAASNLVMTSILRINGGADIPAGTPVIVANGSKSLTVDLAATKTSGIFPAGAYQAQVTVRCE